MKRANTILTILIITTVVIAADTAILDNVNSIMQNVRNLANMHLNNILTSAENLAAETTNRTNIINSPARENINQLLTGLVNAMRNRPESVQLCNPLSPSSVEGLRNVFRKNVDACSSDLRTAIGNLQDTVASDVSELKSTIDQITSIQKYCPYNTEDAVACAAKQSNRVESLTRESLDSGRFAISFLGRQIPRSMNQMQTCVNQSVEEARTLVNKVIESLYQCP